MAKSGEQRRREAAQKVGGFFVERLIEAVAMWLTSAGTASSTPRGYDAAHKRALAMMDDDECVEWAEGTGRYSSPDAAPRFLPPAYLTHSQRQRWINREGEFAD
jgi:hypothetical protein